MSNKTVNVLGAGPAGLASAVSLANNGFKVVVHEKRSNLGGSFEDTVHSIKNYKNWFQVDALKFFHEELNYNIQDSFYAIERFRKYFPNGDSYVAINKDRPILYNVRRGRHPSSLDNELLNQCIALGVEIEFNSKISQNSCDIIATGAKHSDFKGYGIHYKNFKIDDLKEVKVFFNESFSPKGYAYIVPFSDGTATMAVFLTTKEAKKDMPYYYKKFLDYLDQKEIYWSGEPVSEDAGIGFFNLPRKFERNGQKLVGVAGGLMTADYGFALTNALVSGNLAARSLKSGESYNKLIMDSIYPELVYCYLKRLKMDRYNEEDIIKMLMKDKSKLALSNGIVNDRFNLKWYHRIIAETYSFFNSKYHL